MSLRARGSLLYYRGKQTASAKKSVSIKKRVLSFLLAQKNGSVTPWTPPSCTGVPGSQWQPVASSAWCPWEPVAACGLLCLVSLGAIGSLQLPLPGHDSCEESEGYEFTLPSVVLVGGAAMAAGEMVTAMELRSSFLMPQACNMRHITTPIHRNACCAKTFCLHTQRSEGTHRNTAMFAFPNPVQQKSKVPAHPCLSPHAPPERIRGMAHKPTIAVVCPPEAQSTPLAVVCRDKAHN
eukprot:1147858-Pelagomonas_calceolata.AAC.8